MGTLLPYLIIQAPDGGRKRIDLTKTRYTFGRLPDNNDIGLPEEDGIITRIEHCTLERDLGCWILTDKSTNGTQIERGNMRREMQKLPDRKAPLSSDDVIHIHNWQITFHDPNQTNPLKTQPRLLPKISAPVCPFVYAISQATLYRREVNQRTRLEVRPQVNKMLSYMAQKNVSNQGKPVLCTYGELYEPIWGNHGDSIGRAPGEINGLAREIRKVFTQSDTLAQNSITPEDLLRTVTGQGYILEIDCEF